MALRIIWTVNRVAAMDYIFLELRIMYFLHFNACLISRLLFRNIHKSVPALFTGNFETNKEQDVQIHILSIPFFNCLEQDAPFWWRLSVSTEIPIQFGAGQYDWTPAQTLRVKQTYVGQKLGSVKFMPDLCHFWLCLDTLKRSYDSGKGTQKGTRRLQFDRDWPQLNR